MPVNSQQTDRGPLQGQAPPEDTERRSERLLGPETTWQRRLPQPAVPERETRAVPSRTWPEHGSDFRRSHVVFDNAHHGEWLDTVVAQSVTGAAATQPSHIVRCVPCQLIHAWPLPDEAALTQYYQTTFYQRSHPDYVARYERDREWWIMTHQTILMAALPHVPVIQEWEGGGHRHLPSLLEIGSGPGIALDVAKAMGCRTFGLELDATLAASTRARGHSIREESWQTFHVTHGHPVFDLVYVYEVLEHQVNPEALLLACWDFLRVGGVLVVEVPNDYNPLQLAACARHGLSPWWLAPPEHLTYFTPETLRLLMRRCGFDLVVYRSTYPMEQFLLAEPPVLYVGNDLLGRICHEQRMATELAQWKAGQWSAVDTAYTEQLQHEGSGRELVAIATKRP